MRPAHLLVLHGPHHDLLGDGPLADEPTLATLNKAIAQAVAGSTAGLRTAQGNTEAELVAALHQQRAWATHVLVSPGALAPTANVLREALALLKLRYAEVFLEALPGSADHAKRSVLTSGAELQKRGAVRMVYLDAAEKLLAVRLARAAVLADPPKPAPVAKDIGRTRPRAEAAAVGKVAKTIGRRPALAVAAAEPERASSGITRAAVRDRIARRLGGKSSPAELATWAREQWLAVERGAATESGQRELLSEALQALALSSAPGGLLSEPELLDWMAKMG
jgi:3-dehydroquinate dehydratase-2